MNLNTAQIKLLPNPDKSDLDKWVMDIQMAFSREDGKGEYRQNSFKDVSPEALISRIGSEFKCLQSKK